MKILSWNVNGIRSVYRKGFLNWLKKENPDILCLQEIKANTEDIPLKIRDCREYFCSYYPSQKKGYSGTAIFSKQKPIEVTYGTGTEKFDREGRILIMKFLKFTLINVYFPHGRRDKLKIPFKLEMYASFCKYLKRIKGNVVLCGDFNIAHNEIDLARPKGNKNNTMFLTEEREQIDILTNMGFVDTFRYFHKGAGNYTWWAYIADARRRNIGWRIDYIFISDALIRNLKDAFILSGVLGSDHCPIGIEVEM